MPRGANHHRTRKGNHVVVTMRDGSVVEGIFRQQNDRHCLLRMVDGTRWRMPWSRIENFSVQPGSTVKKLREEGYMTSSEQLDTRNVRSTKSGPWSKHEIAACITRLIEDESAQDIAKVIGRHQAGVYQWKKWLTKGGIPRSSYDRVPHGYKGRFRNIVERKKPQPPVTSVTDQTSDEPEPQQIQPVYEAPVQVATKEGPGIVVGIGDLPELISVLDKASHECLAIAEDIEKLKGAISALHNVQELLQRAASVSDVVARVQARVSTSFGIASE